uniref:Uncharacterized protein n=1 Tax=Astyanax mexicanus TaxID=7994 RepID=A0A3B1IKY5_ASTMX
TTSAPSPLTFGTKFRPRWRSEAAGTGQLRALVTDWRQQKNKEHFMPETRRKRSLYCIQPFPYSSKRTHMALEVPTGLPRCFSRCCR